MGILDEVNLEPSESWSAPPARRGTGRFVVLGVVVLLAAAAAGWWWLRPQASREALPVATSSPPPTPPPASKPTPASTLPALDALDPTMRELIAGLTSSPLFASWLATDNLARQIAALVAGASGPRVPLRFLSPLRPAGSFAVIERQGRWTVDPAAFHRADRLTDAFAAIEPVAAARLYRTLLPRLEDAYAELGEDDRTFDIAFREALAQLAAVPILEAPVAVVPRGGAYVFADPRLEGLTPAQKLLLRTGPDNTRRLQAQLLAIRAELDKPAPSQ